MQNKYDVVLVRYGELSLKGKNKNDFTRRLLNNLKLALTSYPDLTYERVHDRLYIHVNGYNHLEIGNIVGKVFGISSYSYAKKVSNDIEEIVDQTYELVKDTTCKTFKVFAKRKNKMFPLTSDEINRKVATKLLHNLPLKVDVHNP
ncbi:MAG: THUMP domain-containing protein, partial [Erysipelotrichaceae bacterium]